ncbi:universal stress protein UspA [Rhodococcus rhodnii]|uniref:UspA domain-containing protein n=2 Tax=Rhodococcus rhodnii TaxID=38312 RepID=R7WN43_9NOCA|nr:universal stress protein [Rhodococcus rhodnii]EOM76722.1 hypothetical protein Rrhod_1841 [Rhodococcus rhodnii LMG 5362]TXG90084.1 universal stress protein UspA [Rhodococcus rhodnii]
MAERILVCVNYGHTGLRLIGRGTELARESNAALHVLVFDSLHEEYSNDRRLDIEQFEAVARGAGAGFAHVRGRGHDITTTIRRAAEDFGATQIVIGQRVESVWTTLLGGSIVDALLEEIPTADLHVVPAQRVEEHDEWEYEAGARAYLCRGPGEDYVLSYDDGGPASADSRPISGIFFKDLQTDFDHGIFVFPQGGRVREVTVTDGVVRRVDLETLPGA